MRELRPRVLADGQEGVADVVPELVGHGAENIVPPQRATGLPGRRHLARGPHLVDEPAGAAEEAVDRRRQHLAARPRAVLCRELERDCALVELSLLLASARLEPEEDGQPAPDTCIGGRGLHRNLELGEHALSDRPLAERLGDLLAGGLRLHVEEPPGQMRITRVGPQRADAE